MKVQIISTSSNRRELELEQVKHYIEGNGCMVTEEDFGLKTIGRIELEKKIGCEVIIGGCLPKINPAPIGNYHLCRSD